MVRPVVKTPTANCHQPLADGVRPQRLAFESGRPHCCILWGSPGVGKTTIARPMAHAFDALFMAISAALGGVKGNRDAVEQAQVALDKGRRTILLVDEAHRFNKAVKSYIYQQIRRVTVQIFGLPLCPVEARHV